MVETIGKMRKLSESSQGRAFKRPERSLARAFPSPMQACRALKPAKMKAAKATGTIIVILSLWMYVLSPRH